MTVCCMVSGAAMKAGAFGDCPAVGVSLRTSSGARWSEMASEAEKEQCRILNVSDRRIASSSSMPLIFFGMPENRGGTGGHLDTCRANLQYTLQNSADGISRRTQLQ